MDTQVISPFDGVIHSRQSEGNGNQSVMVRTVKGIIIRWFHLYNVAVDTGDRVARGDLLGLVDPKYALKYKVGKVRDA